MITEEYISGQKDVSGGATLLQSNEFLRGFGIFNFWFRSSAIKASPLSLFYDIHL